MRVRLRAEFATGARAGDSVWVRTGLQAGIGAWGIIWGTTAVAPNFGHPLESFGELEAIVMPRHPSQSNQHI